MRKITREAAQALKAGGSYNNSNTTVNNGVLALHGNTIAIYDSIEGKLTLRDAGWQSNTTKERLNGILDTFGIRGGIFQKNFEWFFLNGYWGDENHTVEAWNGWKVLEV